MKPTRGGTLVGNRANSHNGCLSTTYPCVALPQKVENPPLLYLEEGGTAACNRLASSAPVSTKAVNAVLGHQRGPTAPLPLPWGPTAYRRRHCDYVSSAPSPRAKRHREKCDPVSRSISPKRLPSSTGPARQRISTADHTSKKSNSLFNWFWSLRLFTCE